MMDQFKSVSKLTERMVVLLDNMEPKERMDFMGVAFFMIALRIERGQALDEEGFNDVVQTTLRGLDGEV